MKQNSSMTASIVLYKENINDFQNVIKSVLNSNIFSKLYLIDNSPSNELEKYVVNETIDYQFVGKNIGFGAGHNLAISKLSKTSRYHLVLNPDVSFSHDIIHELINKLESDKNLAFIAPKVLFPNGRFQNSCRRYPKLSELFFRRLPFFKVLAKSIIKKGIYADRNLNASFYAEYMTGCFHLYKTEDLVKIRGFDERYFLYMEDVDICKKIDAIGKKKLYYPKVHIYHTLKKGSSKNVSLFIRHIISMIKYFNKWGFKI